MPEGLDHDWHPASRRQLVIVLSGTVEAEASDATKRWRRGYRTRTMARVLFVHLPPETDIGV
jgi:hypothetical protein